MEFSRYLMKGFEFDSEHKDLNRKLKLDQVHGIDSLTHYKVVRRGLL